MIYHSNYFFKTYLDKENIPVKTIRESNYLMRIIKMRKEIITGSYDIVLSFLGTPNFICEISSFYQKKWKLVVGERNANPNILKSPKQIFYRFFHLIANNVVANSNENIRLLKKINPLLPSNKISVIYNTVDLNYWKPDHQIKQQKSGKLKIVIIGRYHQQKNLDGLIESVNLLTENEKDQVSIDWYGECFSDKLINDAKIKISKYGLTHVFSFYKPTKSIKKIILSSDFVGLFSKYEGLPNAICEGMACGKPIIASAVSDVPILVQDGVNGFLCDPQDTRSIVNAIQKAMSASQEKLRLMGKASRKKAEELFEPEKIISQYMDLFVK